MQMFTEYKVMPFTFWASWTLAVGAILDLTKNASSKKYGYKSKTVCKIIQY
jgi:hypothetical protein